MSQRRYHKCCYWSIATRNLIGPLVPMIRLQLCTFLETASNWSRWTRKLHLRHVLTTGSVLACANGQIVLVLDWVEPMLNYHTLFKSRIQRCCPLTHSLNSILQSHLPPSPPSKQALSICGCQPMEKNRALFGGRGALKHHKLHSMSPQVFSYMTALLIWVMLLHHSPSRTVQSPTWKWTYM